MSSPTCLRCGGPLDESGSCASCLLGLGLEPELGSGSGHGSDAGTLSADDLGPGDRLGPYELVERLGSGGMGVVYLAAQHAPLERKVALKIIRAGLDGRRVIARFEAERQTLARLEHPNIARVLDAGESERSRPYFVMELVDGDPITQYCDKRRLSIAQRLALFLAVCRAVHHAHQKGILHRDVKPSNLLVEEHDGVAVPKVIDFGVARAIDRARVEASLYTRHGDVVGTPAYMSPEQADGSPDIDVTSDVYALGVLLYELLAGGPPFDPDRLSSSGYAEMLRILRQEQPARPSTRVGSLEDGAVQVAERRRTSPERLQRQLDQDLDWVVLKALEKERSRRYQSVTELAGDLERHLAGLPVSAGPPTMAYRTAKFVRRHRVGVAAASAVALTLVLGIAAATWGMLRARSAEARALREAETAERVTELLTDVFSASDPARALGAEVTASELLDRGVARVEEQLADEPLLEARLLATLAKVDAGLGRYQQAERLWRRALELRRQELGSKHPDTLRAIDGLATALWSLARYREAEEVLRDGLEIATRVVGEGHELALDLHNQLGLVVWRQSRFDEAESLFRRALELHDRALGPDHTDTLATLNNLANVHLMQERLADAIALYRDALERGTRVRGRDHPATLDVLNNLGFAYTRLGSFEQAERLYEEVLERRRRVLGEEHPRTLGSAAKLADLYQLTGRLQEAESLLRGLVSSYRVALGAEHHDTLWARAQLGGLLVERAQLEEAEELLLATLETRRRVLGPAHYDTVHNLRLLGRLAEVQEDWPGAERWYLEARDSAEAGAGRDDVWAILSTSDLGRMRARLGRPEEAEIFLRDAAERAQTSLAQSPEEIGRVLLALGRYLAAQDRWEEAEKPLLAAHQGLDNADSALVGDAAAELARLYRRLGREVEAARYAGTDGE